MSMQLVGVFDSAAEARNACSRLESAGIDKSSIRAACDFSGSGSPPLPDEDRRGFFAKLFGIGGNDDESVTHYGEAVDRGNAVVTVNLADESRSDEIADILEVCGAFDVDERVEQWKAGGYVSSSVDEEPKVGQHAIKRGGVRIYRTHDERRASDRQQIDRPASVRDNEPAQRAATPHYTGPERRLQMRGNYVGIERRVAIS